MKIGVFDSGIGGLSVLHEAMRALPHEQFVFFADEDHVPYGTKPPTDIVRFACDAIEFLLTLDVEAIVIACNTATSVAVNELRRRFPLPIIGMEPAVKYALKNYGQGRVLVVATYITVRGDKLRRLIAELNCAEKIDLLPLQRLVDFAEKSAFHSPEMEAYLRSELGRYDLPAYSALVLGCTHFNYFKDTFRKILPPAVRIVDGNDGTVRELMRRAGIKGAAANVPPTVDYYYSGRKVTEEEELRRLNDYLRRLDEVYGID